MSLLIKALDKAQTAKANEEQAQTIKNELEQTKAAKNTPAKTEAISNAELTSKSAGKSEATVVNTADMELSLSPPDSTFSTNSVAVEEPNSNASANNAAIVRLSANTSTTPVINPSSNLSAAPPSAKSAANVFSAKGVESSNQNTRLALIAGAGLIALLAMGLYFYQFVDNTPDVFVAPLPPIAQANTAPQQQAVAVAPVQTDINIAEPQSVATPVEAVEPMQLTNKQETKAKKIAKKQEVADEEAFSSEESAIVADNSESILEPSAGLKVTKKTRQSKNNASIASDSASIQVSKSSPQAGINPTLMSAYEAYNVGNDKDAIKLYKQVLQRDVRNVDALLGLGAIAARQGRVADANGWYGKVLEVDPRNNIAQAALLDSQSQGNEQGNETRLKNMLAKHPDDANLYVALGNLYAEQNQWPAAQQAYFDAYSLNKTADNAFNLAVSLDQMGKPKLALPYYQRALEQTNVSSNIDRAALEARIAAIQ